VTCSRSTGEALFLSDRLQRAEMYDIQPGDARVSI
jgi:hypothetical protein